MYPRSRVSVIVNDSVVGCSTAMVAAWIGRSASPITSAAQPATASPAPPASPAPQRIAEPGDDSPDEQRADADEAGDLKVRAEIADEPVADLERRRGGVGRDRDDVGEHTDEGDECGDDAVPVTTPKRNR